MKILTVIGARPQFIKAAAVSRAFKAHAIEEIIVHTGQHFDDNMNTIFFEELKIPKPTYNLGINQLNHGAMTGRMMEEIEKILLTEKPTHLLVYGDTNSTLAGALAAKKQHIKVIHVEAGLRSFNNAMPEEINRILTDRISDYLFCPTYHAIENLEKEGFENFDCEIIRNGDVMLDSALYYQEYAKTPSFNLPQNYILTTLHRAENTDNLGRLRNIISTLNDVNEVIPVLLLLHPRTEQILEKEKIAINFQVEQPVGYLEMIHLIKHCRLVMTDSGGLQKEAFFFKKFCLTLRDETEWTELVKHGYNILVGAEPSLIMSNVKNSLSSEKDFEMDLYGQGNASELLVKALKKEDLS